MATSITVKNRILIITFCLSLIACLLVGKKIWEIEQFNQIVSAGGTPQNNTFKFESVYAKAYALAKNGRYQDATLLFNQLLELPANSAQIAAVQYNLGNIYMLRGLLVNHNGDSVKDEAEYLLNQAKLAYEKSLKLDHRPLDTRHNLDRVLSMLPENPNDKDDQDKLGIVMGNLPTGLP